MARAIHSTTTFNKPRSHWCDGIAAVIAGMTVGSNIMLAVALFGAALILGRQGRPTSKADEARHLIERLAVVVVAASLWAPPLSAWTRGALVCAALAIVLRGLADAVRRRPAVAWKNGLPTILVGTAADVREAAQLFASHPEHRVRPVATASPDCAPTVLPNGSVAQLRDLVESYGAEHVLVVTPELGAAVATEFGRSRPAGVRISVLPPMADYLTDGVEVIGIRGLPFVSLAPRRQPSGLAWTAKRTLDFVLAALALALTLPVLAMVAIAIVIESGRPIFYRQKRVGRNGRLFDLCKFRSMVNDADRLLPELTHLNEASGPFFKIERDPRVTRVGRLLRSLSIDELPQLFNVLRGDMSLVGPRPFLPSEMEADPDTFTWRLPFLPGITGLWQVAGRSWLPLREGLRMDLSYVEHWSVWLDLKIMARTVRAALHGDRRPSLSSTAPAPLTRARYVGLVDGDQLGRSEQPCDVSIVIVSHESASDTLACLASLHRLSDNVSREILVVDNASTDGTAELVAAAYPEVRVIRKRRRDGFATNANIGSVAAAGRHVMLLNPDTQVFPGALDRLVDYLDHHPDVGAVGPRLMYPDGRHQAAARRFPTPVNTIVRRTPLRRFVGTTAGTTRHLMGDTELTEPVVVDWLLGAALMVRASTLRELGGLDDGFRLYCEDIDLCWRLHAAGWRVVHLTTAVVQHALGELTAKKFFTRYTIWHFRSMARFLRLHGLRTRPAGFALVAAAAPVRRLELIEPVPGLGALSESAA